MNGRYLFVFDTNEYTFYFNKTSRNAMVGIKSNNYCLGSDYAKRLTVIDLRENVAVSVVDAKEVKGKLVYRYNSKRVKELNTQLGKFLDKVYAEGIPV